MRWQGTIDDWFDQPGAWREELRALREVVRGRGLDETLKWGQPCYAVDGKNVVLIASTRDGATVSFFQGALVEDPAGLLVAAGPNTRSARGMRFRSAAEVAARRADLEALIDRAVVVARAGLRVAPPAAEPELPDELCTRLAADPALDAAFRRLTPGRQRAYALLVAGARTPAGRNRRIDRFTERILAGKGPNDCICGHSQHAPRCDGSHTRTG